jgi:hypothetical protein
MHCPGSLGLKDLESNLPTPLLCRRMLKTVFRKVLLLESQTLAAIIVTELQAEAKDSKSYLSLALLDAQKAFDKLWHNSLLRK